MSREIKSHDWVKITAIVTLGAVMITDLLTTHIDGMFTLTLGAIIGGIAGYHIGVQKSKQSSK